ncbi:MAG: DUF2752 domain-containing protein [Isosphaeraceae bacterium]
MIRRRSARERLGRRVRCLLIAAAAGLAGLLGLARTLVPDPRGHGTHTQLGLQPCAFLTVTGRLCPTCGMTTAFAWIVRGKVVRSWQANPAGCVLALLSFPLIAWLIATAVANEPIGCHRVADPILGLVLAAVVVSLAVWLVRLIVSPDALVVPGQNAGTASRAIGR